MKDGQKFEFTLMTPDGRYLQDKEIGAAVQDQLKKAGIRVNLKVVETGSWVDEWLGGD